MVFAEIVAVTVNILPAGDQPGMEILIIVDAVLQQKAAAVYIHIVDDPTACGSQRAGQNNQQNDQYSTCLFHNCFS